LRAKRNDSSVYAAFKGRGRAMTKRIACLVACAVALVAGNSHADSIKPIEGKSIDLGAFGGIAYYTVKPEDYQLIVTLTPSGAETPVRFIATLAPGQSVTLSTPRKLGEPAIEVSFKRQGEGLFIDVPRIGEAAD
jgi:hypothetical protein